MGPLGYVLVHVAAAFHRKKSAASNPGRIRISRARLKALVPHFYASPSRPRTWLSWLFGLKLTRRAALKMHLRYGDSRAAVVVSLKPLVIAADSDDFGGVLLLQFPVALIEQMKLRVGSTLVTVNTYSLKGKRRRDIVRAANVRTIYTDFTPVIADFVTDDRQRIIELRKDISKEEWNRCYQLGAAAMKQSTTLFRDGLRQLDTFADMDEQEVELPQWLKGESAEQRADREEWRQRMPLNWRGALPCFAGTLAIGVLGWYAAFHAPPASKEGGRMGVLLKFVEWLRSLGGNATVIGVFALAVLLCLVITWAVLTNRVTED